MLVRQTEKRPRDPHGQRRGSAAEARYRWTPDGTVHAAKPGGLEFFLLERYCLYASRGGRLFRGQVAHQPYEYGNARMEEVSSLPADQAGFAGLASKPQHICYAPGVDVRILGLERLAPHAAA